jgi:hypothetical protein
MCQKSHGFVILINYKQFLILPKINIGPHELSHCLLYLLILPSNSSNLIIDPLSFISTTGY